MIVGKLDQVLGGLLEIADRNDVGPVV